MRALAFAMLTAFAAPVAAETYAHAYGLGDHPAAPEKGGSLGDLLHVNVALVKADGTLADHVRKGEVVQVVMTVTRAMDRPAVKVRLRCEAHFTDADNHDAPGAEGLCLAGEVGSGPPVPLNLTLKFRGSADDPAATYGVAIEVKDEISGEAVSLMPTWGWEGVE